MSCKEKNVEVMLAIFNAIEHRDPQRPDVHRFGHFLAYAAKLNPELPASWIPAVGWIVTFAETMFAITLLLGFRTRTFALLSGIILLAFASGMTIGTGINLGRGGRTAKRRNAPRKFVLSR